MLDYFGLVSQSDLLINPTVCSVLFQLPILLPEKFPARSSKPVFLFALSFQRLKDLSACFPPVCQPDSVSHSLSKRANLA